MKKFTKGALIIALVFTVLGFTLCAIGAGIGFHYTSIPKMLRNGFIRVGINWDSWDDAWDSWDDILDETVESWDEGWDDFDDTFEEIGDNWGSWSSEKSDVYDFAYGHDSHGDHSNGECADIYNLELSVNVGTVKIEEVASQQDIHVEVQYQKENSKREVRVSQKDGTLKIEEDETSWKQINTISNNNDRVRVILQIPEDMNFKNVELKNSAGEIVISCALRAEDIRIIVDAGEVTAEKEVQASGKLYAEVDAGEIDFAGLSAEELELVSGVGEINVEKADAKEIVLDNGVGELNINLGGQEEDYSYTIACGMGDVEIGGRSYSGLGTTKKVSGGSKTVDIDCGIGEVNVDFTK